MPSSPRRSRARRRSSTPDRKSTRLNSSHTVISYAVFCLKKKKRIAECSYILEDHRHDQSYGARHKLPKLLELKEYRDQYVIGQEGTKKKLAVGVYNHYKR